MSNSLAWRRWWNGKMDDACSASVRITLALTGVMAACLALDHSSAAIPLLLGVIASALAETDDNWQGRLRAQLTTLVCFALIIGAVRSSLAHPVYLMLVLVAAAFLLTLLGALGERYRAMASATLIMALYAVLASQPQASRTLAPGQELLLLCGAAWHGLVSVLWSASFPKLAVEQSLARLYAALGQYLQLKSRLFEPVRGIDLEQRRLALALHNGRVVETLNAAKESLFSRVNPKHVRPWLVTALHQFFVAQDVHERTSSSHEHYELLANSFFHSDVLYRCQRLLARLGSDCLSLAEALRRNEEWSRDEATARAIDDLEAALAHIDTAPAVSTLAQRARHALRALAGNLEAMDQEISGVQQRATQRMPVDSALQDSQPRTLDQFRKRLLAQMRMNSPLLRHAIRLSVALLTGYALMLITGDGYGFWILLTIVFVCQPHYGATLTRLSERIAGTLLGLVIGWALLKLFPEPSLQALFIVAATVLFFMLRTTRYTLATAGITIFVLLSFNQVGDGYGLIVPRLLDTLSGSLIAALAVWLVLPSWHALRLPRLAADALRAQSRYLSEIMAQYAASGKHDNLAYRIARRDAHNADAALSSALTAALKEPAYVRRNIASGTRFLVLSHTLLNYLSALGAHRHAQGQQLDDVIGAADGLHAALERMAAALEAGQAMPPGELPAAMAGRPAPASQPEPDRQRLLRAQLDLALRLLPALRATAGELTHRAPPQPNFLR